MNKITQHGVPLNCLNRKEGESLIEKDFFFQILNFNLTLK